MERVDGLRLGVRTMLPTYLGREQRGELSLHEELVFVHRLDDGDGARYFRPVRVDHLVQARQRRDLELGLFFLEHA